MKQRRLAVISFLALLPILVCIGFGVVAIFQTGYVLWLWWILPACWVLAGLVNWIWPKPVDTITIAPMKQPRHWTQRDQQAAEIVLKHQRDFANLKPEDLSDPQHYLRVVQSMAADLANHYHGATKREIESLSVVEVAAAARLAIDDIEGFLLHSIPGSRMLSIKHWKWLTRTPEIYAVASKVYWAGAIVLNPINLLRYGSAKVTLDPVINQVKTETIATIYTRFVAKTGFYLIEMNSGRLRGGADAYRQHFGDPDASPRRNASATRGDDPDEDEPSLPVTITLVGQTGAGKSSLINALLHKSTSETVHEHAQTDALPNTREAESFEWTMNEQGASFTLVDTPGYGESGASKKQVAIIERAMTRSDLVLLVMDAHTPAKKADQQTLATLDSYFHDHPQFKSPPIIAVLTHIDLIPPASVWNPPYDLDTPTEAKEENIEGAIQYAREIFPDEFADVCGVCLSTDLNRQWGVDEFLIPAMVANVDQGRSLSLLRAFEKHVDLKRVRKLLSQVGSLARHGASAWIERRL
ncbi:tRNA modification GTPase TrmE [Rubripirellula amarantea]|uniref:tRNA modification GTPase TrmE n=1 Tax=Rubripirellula amarantea TaxID=2527999 RepID=A0A5C5WEF9_9BACT|nr:GTPase domain-containing protein [Rubripirellula amarantea]TWT49124.1 tRNA modification GTPase TrmE [Rubripirellula amarantea]